MVDDNVQAKLAALREQYRLRLTHDLQTLLAQARELSTHDQGIDPASLETLRQGLHRNAGSAGTFGYAKLGQEMRELELWLQAAMESDIAPTTSMLTAMYHRLEEILRELLETPDAAVTEARNSHELASGERAVSVAVLAEEEVSDHLIRSLKGFGYTCHKLSPSAEDSSMEAADAVIVDAARIDESQWKATLEKMPSAMLILLSDDGGFDARLHAVRHGAQGFFIHPVDVPSLERGLRHLINLPQQDPYRALIVDDDVELAEHFRLTLKSAGIESRVINEPRAALQVLRDFVPDLVLIDINMPGCSGPELARIIRFDDDWLKIPLIYLSAESNARRQAQALAQAGDDFLVKPITDVSLIAAVTARAQRSRQLSLALARDGLTGLIKHPAIKELIEIELARSLRTQSSACVVMIDIDRFKSINDTYGHATGDYVIRLLANLLRQRLRRVDHIGRYGGEEFVAILPACSLIQARDVVERIRQNFARLDCVAGAQTFHTSFSAGISCTDDWGDADGLLEAADRAMYEAKQNGRDQVCLAHSPQSPKTGEA
ncbi:GGDEF domain-containing response regulator [Salinicola aestuarinus]|uniref:GGDEF domain-containing response regulator n=1 Tax=Salinicola aestuarinus TaxID=1949082 RepID=UPI000DA22630|nr:diguanylate cyclase [Salinicola aestuarinus]